MATKQKSSFPVKTAALQKLCLNRNFGICMLALRERPRRHLSTAK